MPRRPVSADASAKIILFGEHAVVYGRPALAVPVPQLRATASISSEPGLGDWLIEAQTLERATRLADLPARHPLAAVLWATFALLGRESPAARLSVRSAIPMASGLGSGAAVSAAIVRAVALFFNVELAPEVVSMLVYEVEGIHHGSPSGIDNTVIAYARPVFFRRGDPPEMLTVPAPFRIAIADSGVASSTRTAVAGVRERYLAQPDRYNALFDDMGRITSQARESITAGRPQQLGPLMDENHALLQQIGVSTPLLNEIVKAARAAGASGAKLSGAGLGGNVIALLEGASADRVQAAVLSAGAKQVFVTEVNSEQ